MLFSTYQRAGEPVLLAAGVKASAALFCELLFIIGGLPDRVYTLTDGTTKTKVKLPKEMLELKKPSLLKNIELEIVA